MLDLSNIFDIYSFIFDRVHSPFFSTQNAILAPNVVIQIVLKSDGHSVN